MSRKRTLIIDNNEDTWKPLTRCIDGPKAFAIALEQVGKCKPDFQTNLKSEDLQNKINDFIVSIEPSDFVIFYFSGYISSWRDQHFLLPADKCIIRTRTDMHHYGINVQAVIDDMADMNPQAILFLFDCCQANPVLMKTSTTVSKNQQFGRLIAVEIPDKTVVGFSVAITEASHDQSIHASRGLFTKYLSQHIKNPKIDLQTILNKVRCDVAEMTKGSQWMFQYSTLAKEVFFAENGKLFLWLANLFRMNVSMMEDITMDTIELEKISLSD